MAIITDTSAKLNEYLKTPQHRSYFLIFATVVFVFIMVVFGVLPAYSAFTLQGEENSKRQMAVEQLSKKLSDLKSLATQAQENEALVNYFDYIFPTVIDQDVILDELMTVSTNSGVFLTNTSFKNNPEVQRQFSTQNVNIDANVESLTITVNLEGSQQSLNQFLGNLEKKSRVFNVANFNITRKPQQEISSTSPDRYYNLVLTLSIYSYKDNSSSNN
jgi:Tfp pilus assembly protein PilO